MITNYAFKTLLNFGFKKKKKKTLLNFTMYVVPQKRKRNSRICYDVYLYYHNICPLLIFSVTLLRSLKSFKKQKRKCNTAFVSFFFPLMLVVFLNIQIFKISNFPTLDHIFKIFQETNISKKVFRKKLDKLFPNKHHHIHDQARNQYLV